MKAKKIVSILFALTVCALMGWLFYEATRPEILPVGSDMPALEYTTPNGNNVLKPDSAKVTIVVLFHRNCDHCVYQLNQFNVHLQNFTKIKIILLTTDKHFFNNNAMENWPALARARNIDWGQVKKDSFRKLFGSVTYPGIYIFDRNGKLGYKIHGEVKIAKIIKIIQNFGGPERQISGKN